MILIAAAIALTAALSIACNSSGRAGTATPSATGTAGGTPGVTVTLTSPTPTQDAGSETPTAPVASPSPEQPTLEAMVLKADDLPAGLVRVSAVTSTNADVASAAAKPAEQMAILESWGRLLGYDVTFQPGPDAPQDLPIRGVNSTASLYKTPDGAKQSFADGAHTARTQDWQKSYSNLSDVRVREIKQPELADEVAWIRITGLQGDKKDLILVDDFVLLRRGRVRGFLRITTLFPASAGQDAYHSEVGAQAARQVQLIDSAMAGS